MHRVILLLLITVMLSGCMSETLVPGHEGLVTCVGLNQEPDPRFVYKLSARNLFLAVLFHELIVPPIVVVLDELWCPVALKPLT